MNRCRSAGQFIFCSLTLIAIQMSCRARNHSAVKEEGLFLATNQSLVKVVSRMAGEYKWDLATQASALNSLKKVIPATFNIVCDGSAGSAVFIGPNGEFATVAHVIDKSHFCHIQTLKLAGGDVIVGEDSYVLVAIDKTKRSISRFDLSQGSIVGMNSPDFLQPSSSTSYSINQMLLNLGFPSATSRNGRKIFYRGQPMEAKVHSDELFNAYCGDGANQERLKKIENLGSFDPEWSELYKTEMEACSIAKSEREQQRPVSYDLIPRSETSYSLALGYGKLAWFDQHNGIVTTDSFHGMSGGPLVNLNSGALVGLNDRGVSRTMDTSVSTTFSDLTDLTSIYYDGAKIIQLVSSDRLASLPKVSVPMIRKVTSEQFKNCLNAIRQNDSRVAFTRVEERDGFVKVALFANDRTYEVQMKSAVPKQTQFYRVVTSSGMKIQLKVAYDTDDAGSTIADVSEKSGQSVAFTELKAREIAFGTPQTEALRHDLAEYWMAMKGYVENQLKSQNPGVDAPGRVAAAAKIANDVRPTSVPHGILACTPVMDESENLELRSYFGLGL